MRAPKETVETARHLRRHLSPPEARLWSRLRARIPGAPVFRRQHPIGAYVLDFYCAEARLAVEVDGIGHDMGDRPQRDLRRDAWLTAQGVTVMRISATEVMRAFDAVVDAIVRTATARIDGEAPSTALRAVPLPRFAEEEGAQRRRGEGGGAHVKGDPDQLGPLDARRDENGQSGAGVIILPCEAGEGNSAQRGGRGER